MVRVSVPLDPDTATPTKEILFFPLKHRLLENIDGFTFPHYDTLTFVSKSIGEIMTTYSEKETYCLLLVLNSMPQRMDEVLKELRAVAAKNPGPFGGARNLSKRFPKVLERLDESDCLTILGKLKTDGFVSGDAFRFWITYAGIRVQAAIIRHLAAHAENQEHEPPGNPPSSARQRIPSQEEIDAFARNWQDRKEKGINSRRLAFGKQPRNRGVSDFLRR